MKTAKLENIANSKKLWEVEGVEWREVKFLDKINLIKGTKPKNVVSKKRENTLPYLTTEYFREKIIKEYIPLEENKITIVNEGDLVIIADGSRSGELFFCDRKGVLVSTMAKFEFDEEEINKKFLFWFLTTHFEHLNKSKYTATPHVNKNYLKNLKIPLPFCNGKPDLETQKKIVEYIEVNFSRINKILKKKKQELERLDELWESVLEQAFKPKEGEEWREVKLGELISKEKYQVGKVKVRNCLTNSGKVPVVDQGQELIRGYLNNEDLKYRGPLPVIIFGDHTKVVKFIDFPFIVGADGVKILIPNTELVYPKYFYWLLRTVKLPEKGYARHFKFLKQALYLIPFRNSKPDLEKQKEIASYLDSVYGKIKTLKEKIQNQITHLKKMKGGILNMIFNIY